MSSAQDVTYDLSILDKSAEAWRRSGALRAYYRQLFAEVMQHARPGPTLELGSGIGSIREFHPQVETSDLLGTRFVMRAVSAYAIEDTGMVWSTIVLVDVLHHLCEPWKFFESAARSLAPGGRVLIADPAATAFGRLFYGMFHHEPCLPAKVGPEARFEPDPATGEFANMGLAWALFHRDAEATQARLEKLGLRQVSLRWRDVLAYPSTGGFSKPSLLPPGLVRALLGLEGLVPQVMLRFLGLRMIVVLEKASERPSPTPP